MLVPCCFTVIKWLDQSINSKRGEGATLYTISKGRRKIALWILKISNKMIKLIIDNQNLIEYISIKYTF